MNKFKSLITKNLSGKKVLLLFVLTNIIYALMLLVTIPKVMAFSNGMKLLDMMPTGYSLEYVKELFQALGESGRNAYLFSQIPVDFIYPALFGVSYCLILAYFLNKLNRLDSSYFYLCLLPLIAGSADYLENLGIITMLITFPDLSLISASFTNIFSIVKSMSTTVYFIVLLVTLVIFGFESISKKKIYN